MPSNSSPTLRGKLNKLHQPSIASTEEASDSSVTPHAYSQQQHTEYIKITTGNTACDSCQGSNSACLQRCSQCGFTTCVECHLNCEYDNHHILSNLDLDWSYERPGRRRGNRVKQAQAGAKMAKRDGAIPKPEIIKDVIYVGGIGKPQDSNSPPASETSKAQPPIKPTEVNGQEKRNFSNVPIPLNDQGRALRALQPGPAPTPAVGGNRDECSQLPSSMHLQTSDTLRTLLHPAGMIHNASVFPCASSLLQPQTSFSLFPGLSYHASINGTGMAGREVFEPSAECFRKMSAHWEQQDEHDLAQRYAFMAKKMERMDRCVACTRGDQPQHNDKGTSTGVNKSTEALGVSRGINPQNNMFQPGLKPPSTPTPSKRAACEGESAASKEHTDEVPDKNQEVPIRFARKVRFGDTTIINEAEPDTVGTGGDGHPPTKTIIHGIEWNHGVFPTADKQFVADILVQGGIATAGEFCERRNIKTILKHDQWAINNPKDFERQWECVQFLIDYWNTDEHVLSERANSGILAALRMLEGACSVYAISQGMPPGSFWVFWVEGSK
ncbi:hypothetical protein NUW58_g4583 [Xylaria curta]|uniref:Uncharacterized protein n=1 Tax=Xylaria curta TaxID=42375 RepID=A0ACC1P8R3_9PEZI|nr:hypothetical protein NUW58_g4583 [Xylaria curta]